MIVTTAVEDIRKTRWSDPMLDWGLVPTMGALHAGHLSLVAQARQENARVAVSIFVNPIQFNDPRDLEAYPRDLPGDLAQLKAAGVDLVWTPGPAEMYPPHYQTYVEVEALSRQLEGAARPGHFRGVTTVVSKLFNVFQPQRAYFGQKDIQQVQVIKRMVADLNFNLEVVVCPTMREADGLAMSSRNVRLSMAARAEAPRLYRSLQAVEAAYGAGETDAETLRQLMRTELAQATGARIDYVSIADPLMLAELDEIDAAGAICSIAVFVDPVRLIDNVILPPRPITLPSS